MWRQWIDRTLVVVTLAASVFTSSNGVEIACGQAVQSSELQRQASWAPPLYAFDFEFSDSKHRSLRQEAQMLRDLGFDGVGYLLWRDEDETDESGPSLRMFGEDFDKNLQTLDEVGLPPLGFGVSVNLKPNARRYDPRLVEVMRKLKGRPALIAVMLDGFPSGDKRGESPAVNVLRELGRMAVDPNHCISIYHHVDSWARRFDDALRIAKQVNHKKVGVNFNLAHWLAVEGKRDYRPSLRAAGDLVFDVTINGAKVGATEIPRLIQPLDQGDFDNRKLLAMLRQMDYRGPIGLQCFGIPGDAREHLQRSMNEWRTWQAEWANDKP